MKDLGNRLEIALYKYFAICTTGNVHMIEYEIADAEIA